MTSLQRDTKTCQWIPGLASALDQQSAPRFVLLVLGAVLARGRGTITSWIRAARLSDQLWPWYTTVAAASKKADEVVA